MLASIQIQDAPVNRRGHLCVYLAGARGILSDTINSMLTKYTIDQLVEFRRALESVSSPLSLPPALDFVLTLSDDDLARFLSSFDEALQESLRANDPVPASFLLNTYQFAATYTSSPMFAGDFADEANRALAEHLAKK